MAGEVELTPWRRTRSALDRACDGAYLATSVGDYQSGVSGHAFGQTSWDFNELLLLDCLFGFFGFVAGLCGKRSEFGRSYTYFRLGLSGLKNGRHAMVNVVTVEMMAHHTHHAIAQGQIAAKFLSPVGGIAVGLGLLLAINNLILHRWQQQREHDLCMMRLLVNDKEEGKQERINAVMPPCRQKRMHLMTQGDAATDGLYVSGYVYMMAIMLGAHAAAGPIGWAILAFYLLYTGLNCFYRGYKERLKQVDHEIQYVKFLSGLSEEERGQYLAENKQAHQYCQDHGLDGKLKCSLYLMLLTQKQNKLKSGRQYTLYQGCDWFFSIARKVSNYMKNMFSAAFGIAALAAHSAIQHVTKHILPKIVGGVMAFGLLLMSFLSWRDRRRQADRASKNSPRGCFPFLCGVSAGSANSNDPMPSTVL